MNTPLMIIIPPSLSMYIIPDGISLIGLFLNLKSFNCVN